SSGRPPSPAGTRRRGPGTGDSGRNLRMSEAGFCTGVSTSMSVADVRGGELPRVGRVGRSGLPGPGGGAPAHLGEALPLFVDDRRGVQGLEAAAGQAVDLHLELLVGARGADEIAQFGDV